jgi:hypothetical protein
MRQINKFLWFTHLSPYELLRTVKHLDTKGLHICGKNNVSGREGARHSRGEECDVSDPKSEYVTETLRNCERGGLFRTASSLANSVLLCMVKGT